VLFLEHKHLLRQKYTEDPFPGADYVIPIGKGSVVQEGTDLTIVTYGATVEKSRQAAAALDGVSVEIIDLRCLIPWDRDLVGASVEKTGRVMVVHEDIRTCGFGGEVAAWIAEECFSALDAPVTRIGARDCHVAYEPTLEDAILPQVDEIAAKAREVLAY
jgi:2-oxoisovalerate dehydrogenase E1 component